MLSPERPNCIHVAFDDHRLVANAGLILPVTLAYHLGLGELVDRHVDLGDAPGRANAGDKFLTLVASALAGGRIASNRTLPKGALHVTAVERIAAGISNGPDSGAVARVASCLPALLRGQSTGTAGQRRCAGGNDPLGHFKGYCVALGDGSVAYGLGVYPND